MNDQAVRAVEVTAIPDDAQLLDVREDSEWAAGHAPSAQHIPMSDFLARSDELPSSDEPVYVICRSGVRSHRVAEHLIGQGYQAFNVEGGMQAWEFAGLPLVSEAGADPEII